jgi:hypothetical protein
MAAAHKVCMCWLLRSVSVSRQQLLMNKRYHHNTKGESDTASFVVHSHLVCMRSSSKHHISC